MKNHRFHYLSCLICILFISLMLQNVHAQDVTSADPNLNIRYVSIINLIANTFRFHDSVVKVIGHVRVSSRGTAIYLTKSDAEYDVTKNGLWLNLSEEQKTRVKEFDMKVCGVVGKFDANDQGPQGLWNGSFSEVIAIGPLNKNKS